MKLSTLSFFCALAVLFSVAAISSCSRAERIAGQWQANPERIAHLAGSADASTTVTLDFRPDAESRKAGGDVYLSAVIEVQSAMTGMATPVDAAYENNVAATASVTGHYVYSDDDDDDILISLDPSTFQVNVDPDGVSFAENLLTGRQQPELDSISATLAERWRVALTPTMREVFGRYSSIEDIKVHHGDIMSCEIADRDVTLRRVGVPD